METGIDRASPGGSDEVGGAPVVKLVPPELIQRAQEGDTAAFERLYRLHVGRIHAVCLRMTADPQKAEEATQEAFVKAWHRLDQFQGRSAFSSWLHRLAVNVVLDAKRAEKRRAGEPWPADDETASLPRDTRDPGVRIDLERAIRSLPSGARTAFVLHDVEGYRHREIAEMTGRAEGTWKAQLHRARKLLREALTS
ncbi:MAG: RNA polymerase sigma factor [Gemmatimonadota bacterium]|nr:MAG: RNA polymerase sigma factor [Gemmatimonadota bacterium]